MGDTQKSPKAFCEGLLLLLLITYGLRFSDILPSYAIPIVWASVFAISIARANALMLSVAAAYYVPVLALYLLGSFLVTGYRSDGELVRNLATHFVLTLALLVSLRTDPSAYGRRVLERWQHILVKIGICSVFCWVLFIFKQAQYGGDLLVYEYGGANYLTTSDLLALFGLAVMSGELLSKYWKAASFFITLIALSFLGSRAAVAGFLPAAIFFGIRGASFGKSMWLSIVAAAFVCLLGILAFEFVDSSLLYRIETLFSMSEDESRRVRSVYLEDFSMRLSENSGCYFYPCIPDAGQYVHNILSVHEYFGFFGSILTLVLLANLVLALARGYKPRFGAVLVYALLLALTARAWISVVFPVAVAYLLDAAIFSFWGKSLLARHRGL